MDNKSKKKVAIFSASSVGGVSVIVVVAIVALVVFLLINAVGIGVGLYEKKREIAEKESAITVQDELNSELSNKLKDENASEIYEDIARDEYDYIYPGERVYADSAN